MCDLADWNVQLKESSELRRISNSRVRRPEECGVDLNALSDVIRSLMTIVEQQGVGSGELGADLLGELGAAESEVLEAAGFLADSNDQAEQRVTLRDAAVQRMEAAVTRIGAAVDLASPPAPLDGVWKDASTGFRCRDHEFLRTNLQYRGRAHDCVAGRHYGFRLPGRGSVGRLRRVGPGRCGPSAHRVLLRLASGDRFSDAGGIVVRQLHDLPMVPGFLRTGIFGDFQGRGSG